MDPLESAPTATTIDVRPERTLRRVWSPLFGILSVAANLTICAFGTWLIWFTVDSGWSFTTRFESSWIAGALFLSFVVVGPVALCGLALATLSGAIGLRQKSWPGCLTSAVGILLLVAGVLVYLVGWLMYSVVIFPH